MQGRRPRYLHQLLPTFAGSGHFAATSVVVARRCLQRHGNGAKRFLASQVAFIFALAALMLKFCKNPGRPLRCPYLPTYPTYGKLKKKSRDG